MTQVPRTLSRDDATQLSAHQLKGKLLENVTHFQNNGLKAMAAAETVRKMSATLSTKGEAWEGPSSTDTT